MTFVYLISIRLYVLSVRVASFFNPKAKQWISGRKEWKQKLKAGIDPSGRYVWVHCASLGEFEQGRPVIEALKEKHPGLKIILTFFSPSGYEIRKNYGGADYICYLPSDSPANARFFADTVKPVMAVFIKYEFWYFFIRAMSKRQIPVYLVSGIFRNGQIFFRWYGKWYRNILNCFTHLFVQDETSRQLLSGVGIHHVTVAGDTRFDRVWQIFNNRKDIAVVQEFTRNSFPIICGSTWPADEELLLRWLHQAPNNVKYVIAPHEIHESRIRELVAKISLPVIRFSQLNNADLTTFQVLIIDNIGMLSSLYGYGKIAYVGGGFGRGIHNVAEAAVYGMPIVFGPHYKKFGEATGLEAEGAAFPIHTYNDLENVLNRLYNNSHDLEKSSLSAGNFIHSRIGATDVFLKNASFEF